MRDIRPVLSAYGIPYKEPKSPGGEWIQLNCPECADTKFHLGYNARHGVFHCYRCGRLPAADTLSAILGIPRYAIRPVLRSCPNVAEGDSGRRPGKNRLETPFGVVPLDERARGYLAGRRFDPDDLVSKWGIGSCRGDAKWNGRIYIPVDFRGRTVSFCARDAGDSPFRPKMLSCRSEDEVYPIKKTLYGYDRAVGSSVLVVEGPFDAFRFGPGTVATFGISWTAEQAALLFPYRRVFIMFDSVVRDGIETERKARESAERLADIVSLFTDVRIFNGFGCDPGDMDARQVEEIKRKMRSVGD